MAKSGTPYDADRSRDVDNLEDVPNRDKETVEQLREVEKFDEPVPVRIVDDSAPKQSIRLWRTTRIIAPSGVSTKVLPYHANRLYATVRNEQISGTDPVYLGYDEGVNETTGYKLGGGASLDPAREKKFDGPGEIWVTHSLGANVSLQVYYVLVTEIEHPFRTDKKK